LFVDDLMRSEASIAPHIESIERSPIKGLFSLFPLADHMGSELMLM
jgi:hypothetical protein